MAEIKSRKVQTGRNVVVGFLYKFVILLLNFISRKFFLEYIGVEYLGINSLFSNVLSILCLADLGMGVAMTYSLYKPLSENDTSKISSLINYYKTIYRLIALTVFVLGMVAIPGLKYIVNLDSDIEGLYIYYILFVIETCSSYLFVYKTVILIADQRNYINNIVTMCINLLKVIIQILVIIFAKNYYLYIILDIIGILSINFILSKIVERQYPYLNSSEELSKNEKHNLTANVKSVFIYKLSGVLINSTDNIIISIMLGTAVLGYYSNYYTIINQLSPFLTIIFSGLTASIGNLVVSSDANKQYEVFEISTLVSNFLGLLLTVEFLVLSQDFIRLWIGSQYVLGLDIVIALALNFFYSCINQPIWTYREASGLYLKTKYIMLFTAILNVFLSLLLGKFMGISGVVYATFVSKLFVCFWYEPKVLFKDYFKRSSAPFFIMFLKVLLELAVSYLICYFLLLGIDGGTWLLWILKGTLALLIVTVLFIGFNFKNKYFVMIAKGVSNKIKSAKHKSIR